MTAQIPAGQTPRKRHTGWWVLFTFIVVFGAGAAMAVASGAVKVPHAQHRQAATAISPGCQPQTLWLIWRVEQDADGHVSTGRLYTDIRRLEDRIAQDPYRSQMRQVIRGIKGNTVGGEYVTYRQDFARIVNLEPRC